MAQLSLAYQVLKKRIVARFLRACSKPKGETVVVQP